MQFYDSQNKLFMLTFAIINAKDFNESMYWLSVPSYVFLNVNEEYNVI